MKVKNRTHRNEEGDGKLLMTAINCCRAFAPSR